MGAYRVRHRRRRDVFPACTEVCAPNAPRKPPAAVGADPDEPRWLAYRVREFIGTGLLQIAIRTDGDVACRKTAKDTGTSSLEEKIPSVFNEFASAMERRRKDRQERPNGRRPSGTPGNGMHAIG